MRRMALAAVFVFLIALGCRTNMAPYEAGDPENPGKVLVAGEDSQFKRKVIARVIDRLGTEDWYFKVIGLDELKLQEVEEYGAILLVAGYRAGRLDERVTAYLSGDPGNAKTILLFTRGSDDPLPEKNKPELRIDAVSSASKDERVEQRAEQLVALIERRFLGAANRSGCTEPPPP